MGVTEKSQSSHAKSSKTVIILGGQPPSPLILQTALADNPFVIAADSGVLALLNTGRWPHILTGDFDSFVHLNETTVPPECRVIPAPEQDATDFQKALRQVPTDSREPTEIVILGGTGRRSDHFLTNLLIASAIPAIHRLRFEAENETLHRVTPQCPYSAELAAETTVSLIPFSTAGSVVATGLHWPLNGVDMEPGKQLGQSNVATGGPVSVSTQSGCLYVAETLAP